MEEKIIFYKEWLPFGKGEFRILTLLAQKGSLSANLSDLCRYLSLDPQTKNRRKLQNSIETLSAAEMIKCSKSERLLNLELVPKAERIVIAREWFEELTNREYSVSVSREAVLKVFLWITDNKGELFTNDMMSEDLRLSVTTLNCAKRVLSSDFDAIMRELITTKIAAGIFHRQGQIINVNQWLNL